MNVQDIAESDLTALKAEGYTENDLSQLAESEVQALLPNPSSDDDESQDGEGSGAPVESRAAPVNVDGEGQRPAFMPQYTADVPADAAEQIKTLRGEERLAFKRLMDGEIDSDEYQSVRDRTETEVDDLKTRSLTASIFQQANEQTAQQAAKSDWDRAERTLFNTFKEEGLDYKAKPGLLAAYNHNLKSLGSDPKNENRDAPWFLAEAHRITKSELGIASAPNNTRRNAHGMVDNGELPPTLRAVPTSATGAVNSDEFAHMRNLDGIELEKAHARLTPDQRDRWMAE